MKEARGQNIFFQNASRLMCYCSFAIRHFSLLKNQSEKQAIKLGDNCNQNLNLGRYIVGYTVGKVVLRRRVSGDVKRDFRTYIRRYTSPNENFEYGYPHSNALITFSLQKGSENILCHAYVQRLSAALNRLPTAYIHLSTNEKRRYVMTSGLRQYIAGYSVANL